MNYRYRILDVFTETPLEGNPLAVFPQAAGLDGVRMQALARELNLSETVFVLRHEGAAANIRIFTPSVELPFAGHPVLGTAFVLGEDAGVPAITLTTSSAAVHVRLTRRDNHIVFGEMEQPLPVREAVEDPAALLAALGLQESVLPVEAYRNGPLHVCVSLGREAEVAALRPDMGALAALGSMTVSCCARRGAGEVKTRTFAPALGVPEDPATGSAAGPLAVHLARHGHIEFGSRIRISQGEEIRRPSTLYAQVDGTRERLERVAVGGPAVIVARGEYCLA